MIRDEMLELLEEGAVMAKSYGELVVQKEFTKAIKWLEYSHGDVWILK